MVDPCLFNLAFLNRYFRLARVIQRRTQEIVTNALGRQAAVALIGPRQVGKTTLAQNIVDRTDALYLDLESSADRGKLADARLFLAEYERRLVVLDEIHRAPGLFPELRGLIDRGRRRGRRTGRFLMLGSASLDLLRQAGETLAGRIEYVPLHPFDVHDVPAEIATTTALWVRGGFPDSLLAANDDDSLAFRRNLIHTYLERDVSTFTGRRLPAETLERLWTMLAHGHGTLLNAAKLAASLALSSPTVSGYIDLLVDLLLVRRLRPFHANVGKRLVRSPKIYIRDSGLVHALLGIDGHGTLAGHPVAGASWEGFVIENLLAVAPPGTAASFYRTRAGAEIDLLLELPGGKGTWAVEVKLALSPRVSRGFHHACEDVAPNRAFLVSAGEGKYPLSADVEVVGLRELASMLIDV